MSEEAEKQARLLYNQYSVDGPERRQRKATRAIKRKFCQALANGASVTKACGALEISTAAMYYQRQQDPEFKEAWEDALERAADRYEDRLDELSIKGNHPGSTIFQLKNRRPQKWQDRHDVTVEKHEEHRYVHDLGPGAQLAILERMQELREARAKTPAELGLEGLQKRGHAS
ncbi:MAG: hypothetical protein IIC91_05515 [Chloroflexi bacterium]|nr:hypothetical protein [Chloroflexota bacterium]